MKRRSVKYFEPLGMIAHTQEQLDTMFFLGEHRRIMKSWILPEIDIKRQGENPERSVATDAK